MVCTIRLGRGGPYAYDVSPSIERGDRTYTVLGGPERSRRRCTKVYEVRRSYRQKPTIYGAFPMVVLGQQKEVRTDDRTAAEMPRSRGVYEV